MKNSRDLDIGISASCLFGRPDGVSAYTYTLIKNLSVLEKKDRLHLVYSSAPLFGKNHLDFRQHNIVDHRPLLFLNIAPKLDVFHDTCPAAGTELSYKNMIVTVHGLFPGLKERLSRAKAVIAPSVHIKEGLIGQLGIEREKIHLIPEGAGDQFVPQSTYRISLVRTRYGLKRPYILIVGPLEERKNLSRALEAYGLLRYESPPDLVIAGEKRMELPAGVRYLGYVPKKDMPALYCGSEALLFPSLSEGFGLPALEAMSCGTPVILSKTSALPEVAGNAGVYIDPENPENIADGLRRVLSSRQYRDALKQKGLERAKLFSARRMASDTLKLYRKVALL